MAEVKWIKITTDIFDDEKIKVIDSMPARDEILVIWFKLLTLAGKTNKHGMLFLNNKIPYTCDMLSAIFNRELNTIKLALETFIKFDMIQISDNKTISITNWGKHQNVVGLEKIKEQTRLRVAKHRELLKENVTLQVTQGNATELEEELEREKNKKRKKESFNPLTDKQKFIDNLPESVYKRGHSKEQVLIVIDNLVDYCKSKGF